MGIFSNLTYEENPRKESLTKAKFPFEDQAVDLYRRGADKLGIPREKTAVELIGERLKKIKKPAKPKKTFSGMKVTDTPSTKKSDKNIFAGMRVTSNKKSSGGVFAGMKVTDIKDRKPSKDFKKMGMELQSQIIGLDRLAPRTPFKAQHPTLWAAGMTVKDMPGQVSELGDLVMSGATMGLSVRAKEAANYLVDKLWGKPKKGGATGTWEESELPGWMKKVAPMVGSAAPIGFAGKVIAAPIIQVISKSKHLPAFAQMIGWSTAGATYEGVLSLLSEGELPTPKELAKHGAVWGSVATGVSMLGYGGKLTVGLFKLSKLWGVPKKEVLKAVIADAKAKGMPIAGHMFAKAKAQKALGLMDKRAAEVITKSLSLNEETALRGFINNVDELVKPFEKRGTYQDLTAQLETEGIVNRIRDFKTYVRKGTVLGKTVKPRRATVVQKTNEVERALLAGHNKTAEQVALINRTKSNIKYEAIPEPKPTKVSPVKREVYPAATPKEPITEVFGMTEPQKLLPAGQGFTFKDVPAKIIKKAPVVAKDRPGKPLGTRILSDETPEWIRNIGQDIRFGWPVSKGQRARYVEYFRHKAAIPGTPIKTLGQEVRALSAPTSGYRAETGYKHTRGTKAADIVRYEQDELGNQLGVSCEKLMELEKYPAASIKWVTRAKKDAAKYGKPTRTRLSNDTELIAVDGKGGYLVLDKTKIPVPRQVTAAALKYPDGSMVTGQSHFQCLQKADKMGSTKKLCPKKFISEGFIDQNGKFMSREAAKDVGGQATSEALVRPQGEGVHLGFGITGELQRIYEKLIAQRLHKPLSLKIGDIVPKEPSELAQKMILALSEGKVLRGRQTAIYRAGRSEKYSKMMKVQQETEGEAGFYAELGAQKGAMEKVTFESLRGKISQKDIDGLFNEVKNCPLLSEWEKLPARKGLGKLFGEFGGVVPTSNELALLEEVFGNKFVKEALKKQSGWAIFKKGAFEFLNIPKALMASFDLSAPLRQGIFLIGRPKQLLPAFRDMFKYAYSTKNYEAAMAAIKQRPAYDLAMKNKLSLTNLGDISLREEAFMSNYAEQIPLLGMMVKKSSQAYTGFLNQLRINTFESFVKQGEKLGLQDPKFLQDAARFVNHATGRGHLGQLESSAVQLNAVFFSPRLIASRLQLINPKFYIDLEPTVRREALKSLIAFGAIAGTVASLARLNGAHVGLDPRNADFMKLKFGSTRYDILGGFQQPIRLASQLISGKIISSTTGKELVLGEGYKPITRPGIAGRFLEYKEAPVFSFAVGLLRGTTAMGDKFELPTEIANRFLPMVVQDMKDLYNEQGLEGIPLSAPAFFGVGTQTYGGVSSYGLKGRDYPELNAELDRLKIPMGFPGTAVYGKHLSNKQYNNYKTQAGKEIADTLTKFIKMPGYASLPDDHKRRLVAQWTDEVKGQVKERLFQKEKIFNELVKKVMAGMLKPRDEAEIIAEELIKKQNKEK